MEYSVGVNVQQRGDDIGRDFLDPPAKLVGDLRDRNFVSQRAHDQLLQRTQLFGLADVSQQREQIFDTAVVFADCLDGRRDPGFVAVLIVEQDFFFAVIPLPDLAPQPGQYLAIGITTGQQLLDVLSDDLVDGISEHPCECGIGISDLQFVVRDDNRTVGRVGDQRQQREPIPPFELGGDVPNKDHVVALATGSDTRHRDRCAGAAAIVTPDRDFGGRLLQIIEPEAACVTTEKFRARDVPDQFCRCVATADTEMAVEDKHGIARLLKRSEQKLGTFSRRAIGGVHRSTQGPADNRPQSISTVRIFVEWQAYRTDDVESVCRVHNHRAELIICLRFC
jgi:hypothetical protein